MTGRCSLILGVVILWAACLSTAAARKVDSRHVYNMTAAEVEDVVADWMKSRGFIVFQQSQTDGFVDVLAEKDRQRIRVIIKRHSPIAAVVSIEAVRSDAWSQRTAEALQRYLDGYINLPNTLAEPIDTIPEVVRGYLRAVVCLFAVGDRKEVQITGFAVDASGLIVCTGHDLDVDEDISVLLNDDREISGRVVKIDHLLDLALIRTSAKLDPVIPLRNGRFMLQNGDRLYAITCPKGGKATFQTGFLDGPPRRVQGMPLWQVRMKINHGSSGSPVFDSQGRLAAIVKGRFRGTESIGFLIPFESILQFLEKY